MKPTLANAYKGQDPTGWWMSEKLDGVRAIWTGSELLSRNDKPFAVPTWWVEGLPKDVVLDGELWEGRGLFQQTVGKVRRKDAGPQWQGILFKVFDIQGDLPYRGRYANLMALELPQHVQVLHQIECRGIDHLDAFEQTLLDLGGEGVMLRDPAVGYIEKRTKHLLKVKRFQDSEATVTGHYPGEGKYAGLVGGLLCDWAGKAIKVGTGLTDAQREVPPQVGDRITFRFFEITADGFPRFPAFVAVRNYE